MYSRHITVQSVRPIIHLSPSLLHLPLPLQSIHKFRILSVRQIKPLLILKLHIPRIGTLPLLNLVLSDTPEMDEKNVEETEGVAYDYSDFGGNVSWSIFWSERLGTDDVASACGVGS